MEDWPDLTEDFSVQRNRRLEMLQLEEPPGHELTFLKIDVNAQGEYFEIWNCHHCPEVKHIPYKAGGLPYEEL